METKNIILETIQLADRYNLRPAEITTRRAYTQFHPLFRDCVTILFCHYDTVSFGVMSKLIPLGSESLYPGLLETGSTSREERAFPIVTGISMVFFDISPLI
jgi:hypothetical protein